MGQCVLRDIGFKFDQPDREAHMEQFLMKVSHFSLTLSSSSSYQYQIESNN